MSGQIICTSRGPADIRTCAEMMPLLILAALNAYLWAGWGREVFLPPRFLAALHLRLVVAANALLCLALILVVLVTASSPDVRESSYYVTGYELLAALWLAEGLRLFPFFGVSLRDDVIERRNLSAFWVVNGALIGFAACFAGANVGNGPGPSAAIFCAVLGSLAFFVVWLVADRAGSRWADNVTIERDYGSGLRLGSLLTARAWHSVPL